MSKITAHISMINMDVMHYIFGNNITTMFNYLDNFVEKISLSIAAIECSIHEKNNVLAMNHIHKLKGPVGSIGFNKLYNLCIKTEKEIAESDWESAQQSCKKMQKILKELEVELTNNKANSSN